MKNWYLLLVFIASSCGIKSEEKTLLKNTYWVSSRLDYYEPDSVVYLDYGGGYLLHFDGENEVKTLVRDFAWRDDSLLDVGEPGLIRRKGTYKVFKDKVVLNQKLVEKTFLLPNEKLGMAALDSIKIVESEERLIFNNDTLLPVTKIHKNLKLLFQRAW